MISLVKFDCSDCVVELFSHGRHRRKVTGRNQAGYHATERTFTNKKL